MLRGMVTHLELDAVSAHIPVLHGMSSSLAHLPIFTKVTSKIRVAFGGNPFFGCEP